MKTKTMMALAGMMAIGQTCSAAGRLAARWDFDGYDAAQPTSAAILVPSVGTGSAVACTGNGFSTAVTDGTLGAISVIRASSVGNGRESDFALSIPAGAHLRIPFPSATWAQEKTWMLRIRFCSPAVSAQKTRALLQPDVSNTNPVFYSINASNYLLGDTTVFGNTGEENGTAKTDNLKTRTVANDIWSTLDFYFASNVVATAFNGIRAVSTPSVRDFRTSFTGDGFLIGASPTSGSDATIYVTSVELWEDVACYHVNGDYLPTTQTVQLKNVSLADLSDLYFNGRFLGAWGSYAASISSFDRIVTSDANGVSNLKLELREISADKVIRVEFRQNGSDVTGASAKMCYGLGWPNCYWTDAGGDLSGANYQNAGTTYNYQGYSPYNIYALEQIPLTTSLGWRFFMGHGHFGHPVVAIVGDNPTLTFDRAPSVDGLTLDCGRGDGAAMVTFEVAQGVSKDLADFGDLTIRTGVTLTMPSSLAIAGELKLEPGAKLAIRLDELLTEANTVTFTAAGGILLPAGKTLDECVAIESCAIRLNDDGTKILATLLVDVPVTATWTGAAKDGDFGNPRNWECKNVRGEVLDDGLPNADDTAVTITGDTDFTCPADAKPIWKSLTISGTVNLTADCDWSGLGSVFGNGGVAENATIDLAGHCLTNLWEVDSSVAATVTSSVEGGELHVVVPEGKTVTNDRIALSGSLKLVKDGAGRFTATKTNQPYKGGTEVAAGTLRNGVPEMQYTLGGKPVTGNPEGKSIPIIVRSGATLDVNGFYWCGYYIITLDGGTLYNSTGYSTDGKKTFNPAIILSRDSFLTLAGSGTCNMDFAPALDLQGHRLSVTISGSSDWLWWRGAEMTCFGTLDVTGGGNFKVVGPLKGSNVDLRLNAKLYANAELTVRGYEAAFTGNSEGTSKFTVRGVFKPTSDSFYGCTLADGATVDLSDRETVLSTTSTSTTGSRTLAFEPDATICVNLGDRPVSSGQRIVAWDDDKKPTAKFRLADRTDCGLVSREDGLYVVKGMIIIFR